MVARPARRPARKKPDAYHHGDLRRALLQEAVCTIQAQGVEALTLRAVAEKLGVSRTALYRHFSDKQALLGAVAAEGFRLLRTSLVKAWEKEGRGRPGFEAMGRAYVHFALDHPSHYRVMFGSAAVASEPEPDDPGGNAFQALVDALVEMQQQGLVRDDPPLLLALHVWSTVHGVAMLALDGQLKADAPPADALIDFAIERLRTGIAAAPGERAGARPRPPAAGKARAWARPPDVRGGGVCG
jgi:AcrR family transcriptional regulator